MIVGIVGSREFDDPAVIYRSVWKLKREYAGDLTIVSGGARGADRIAEAAARYFGYNPVVFDAVWRPGGVYNPYAGRQRNVKLVSHVDRLIAFLEPDLPCVGTNHAINEARRGQKPVYVYRAGAWQTY